MEKILEKIGFRKIKKIENRFPTYSFFYNSDNLNVKGFVIFPKVIRGKMPLILFNRGGTGEYSKIEETVLNRFDFFAENGYITFASQYRGVDGGEGKDMMGGDDVFDIINLYEIIKKIDFIDNQRVGIYGVSRGGMMSFQLAVRVEWVKSMVIISSLVDEFKMAKWRDGWREHQIATYGGSEIEMYKRSPIKWFKLLPKNCSILMCHGDKDTRANFSAAKSLAKKINSINDNCKFVEFKNEGHFIVDKAKDISLDWFKKTL